MGLNLVRCTPTDEIKRELMSVYDACDHVREGDDIRFWSRRKCTRRSEKILATPMHLGNVQRLSS